MSTTEPVSRAAALRHSPALWGLLGACAGELLLVAAWNVIDRRADIIRWMKL